MKRRKLETSAPFNEGTRGTGIGEPTVVTELMDLDEVYYQNGQRIAPRYSAGYDSEIRGKEYQQNIVGVTKEKGSPRFLRKKQSQDSIPTLNVKKPFNSREKQPYSQDLRNLKKKEIVKEKAPGGTEKLFWIKDQRHKFASFDKENRYAEANRLAVPAQEKNGIQSPQTRKEKNKQGSNGSGESLKNSSRSFLQSKILMSPRLKQLAFSRVEDYQEDTKTEIELRTFQESSVERQNVNLHIQRKMNENNSSLLKHEDDRSYIKRIKQIFLLDKGNSTQRGPSFTSVGGEKSKPNYLFSEIYFTNNQEQEPKEKISPRQRSKEVASPREESKTTKLLNLYRAYQNNLRALERSQETSKQQEEVVLLSNLESAYSTLKDSMPLQISRLKRKAESFTKSSSHRDHTAQELSEANQYVGVKGLVTPKISKGPLFTDSGRTPGERGSTREKETKPYSQLKEISEGTLRRLREYQERFSKNLKANEEEREMTKCLSHKTLKRMQQSRKHL